MLELFPIGPLMAVLAGGMSLASAAPAMARDPAGAPYKDMPAGAYAVVAEVRAKSGQENALREATLPLVAKVRQEPNNLLYFLQESRETPGHFIFYEIFASEADFDAHNQTSHVQAWFSKLPELAEGGVKVTRMRILGNDAPPGK